MLLGIDTGGTFTDAVLYDRARGVVAKAKALTTKQDLAQGVGEAIRAIAGRAEGAISLVSLSTTLATNAIVEGQGGRVCLILIGLEAETLERAGLRQALDDDPVVHLPGGHDFQGEALAALDLDLVRAAILREAPRVEAFAVAGHFAVRNPAHERAVAELVRELTDRPVTCSHELTAQLDAPRRALTTLLNARLVPLLDRLIRAVRDTLLELGIAAPLLVVRGDGTLVAAEAALDRPIETILSGPAASIAGARALTGLDDALVSDIGGTTTDVAVLRGGRPALAAEGARVGGWRTMVEAVEVWTSGLGGDSFVGLDRTGRLTLGPRRAVPLSLLASGHPEVVAVLRAAAEGRAKPEDRFAGCFAVATGRPGHRVEGLRRGEAALLEAAAERPLPLGGRIANYLEERSLERLLDRGLIVLAGFTPSDAAQVLGLHATWSREAAELGAAIWAARAAAAPGGKPTGGKAMSARVLELLTRRSADCLLEAAVGGERSGAWSEPGALGGLLLDKALAPDRGEGLLKVGLTLSLPVIAVGAPAGLVYPEVARRLNTELVLPEDAGVANAVGAAAGDVSQAVTVLISARGESRFRVHLSEGPRDFNDLEEAAEIARCEAERVAAERARLAGAEGIRVTCERRDRRAAIAGDMSLFIESVITARASGAPRQAPL